MAALSCYCYNEFTYPKFMTQIYDRDFQKVLQALTAFDKKLSTLEDVLLNDMQKLPFTLELEKNLNKDLI